MFLFIDSILRCDDQFSADVSLVSCRTSLPTADHSASWKGLRENCYILHLWLARLLVHGCCLFGLKPIPASSLVLPYYHNGNKFVRFLSRVVLLSRRALHQPHHFVPYNEIYEHGQPGTYSKDGLKEIIQKKNSSSPTGIKSMVRAQTLVLFFLRTVFYDHLGPAILPLLPASFALIFNHISC